MSIASCAAIEPPMNETVASLLATVSGEMRRAGCDHEIAAMVAPICQLIDAGALQEAERDLRDLARSWREWNNGRISAEIDTASATTAYVLIAAE